MAEAKPDVGESLLEIAHPDLYKKNAFRVTDLPVDAMARDISRRQATMKQATGMGLPLPTGYGRVLPLKEPLDPDVFSEATQRLGDPERRLVDEVFWFWPRHFGESRMDTALAALARGESQTVYRFWLQQRDNPDDEGTALHNLAILSHVFALDLEAEALSRSLSEQEQAARATWWQEAFKYWTALVDEEAFWSCVTARIRDLDDPRLTTGMARRIREALPQILLAVNARLAVSAAERGKTAECQRQLKLMRSTGFDSHLIDEALRQAAEPIRGRIKTLCRTVETQAPTNPSEAGDVVERFLTQSLPLLTVLDTILPAGNLVRDGMHDEVAQCALIALVIYGNKTGNWRIVLPLIDRILPIAVGKAICDRIQENRTAAQGNLVLAQCWYCEKNAPNASAVYKVNMYGNVTQAPVWQGGVVKMKTNWQTRAVDVPRCLSCKAAHDRVSGFGVIGCLASFGIIVAALFSAHAAGLDAVLSWISTIATAIMIPYLINWASQKNLSRKGIRNLNEINKFPVILMLQAQKWKIGQKQN